MICSMKGQPAVWGFGVGDRRSLCQPGMDRSQADAIKHSHALKPSSLPRLRVSAASQDELAPGPMGIEDRRNSPKWNVQRDTIWVLLCQMSNNPGKQYYNLDLHVVHASELHYGRMR
jgi:hypothetical protein